MYRGHSDIFFFSPCRMGALCEVYSDGGEVVKRDMNDLWI